MKTAVLCSSFTLLFVFHLRAQEATSTDSSKSDILKEVQVTALRATDKTPTTYQDLDSSFLQRFDSGKDLPMVLNQTPSMVTTSDAGAGVGYTGMRIRGSDATRINVTMNGIPLNDAESQGVFWVNTPDLVSSLNSIQIQRGAGSSTNGAGAFGASVNMNTLGNRQEAWAGYTVGYGSFNTLRQTVHASTGRLSNNLSLDVRLSDIRSDGFIDRASSDLQGYSFQLGWQGARSNLQFLAFGGREKTYQAWYGVDSMTFENNPSTNFAGALTDSNFNITGFYDNEVDDYGQDHFQLHYGLMTTDNSILTVGLHYTRGKGFFEQYRQNDGLLSYGIEPVIIGADTIFQSDLIRRLWLDNHFYGGVFQWELLGESDRITIGGGFHFYEGEHYGDLQWMRFASNSEIRDRYYNNRSTKLDANIYAKWNRQWNEKWSSYFDLQVRTIDYRGRGDDDGGLLVDFSDRRLFFNPKAGLQYSIQEGSTLYTSYALAHREGNRQDYLFGEPEPEQLHDVEAGWRWTENLLFLQLNTFFMFYRNQLVLTGEIDNVGGFIRRNVGRSFRSGIELESNYRFDENWSAQVNLALSRNRNLDYSESIGDTAVSNLGNTPIAFSPEIVGGAVINYNWESWTFSWSSRYVGEQFLSNSGKPRHILPSYFVNDFRMGWNAPKGVFGRPVIMLDVFNVLDEKYASNGYVFADAPFYYPQAGSNVMLTARFSF